MGELRLFGIRHHGPGSAALLVQALDQLSPSIVLIEGPPEADELLVYAALPGMKPPLSILSYDQDAVNTAQFFPFTEYSPEWQAILWASRNKRPVRFIDWPVAVSLAWQDKDAVPLDDPLDLLAEIAGFSDGETFWNDLVEQGFWAGNDPLVIFQAIEKTMTEARAYQDQQNEDAKTLPNRHLIREAFMRLKIREAIKETEGTVAVVAGAWHLAGLALSTTISNDKSMIKDLPRVKTTNLWVPWTNGRLSLQSGYGAGVVSPGWYQALWQLYQDPALNAREQFTAQWQARTACILRDAGYDASTASSIEAARLAISLAALRNLNPPGLNEMRDAALAVFCQGNPLPLSVIESKLYIGETLGTIDPQVPQMPLVLDLEYWQKKLRLSVKAEAEELSLDLRSDAGLLKSTLLHRLCLMKINWGTLLDAEAGRGTFREIWRLAWQPEFSVALAEALVYGVTVKAASGGMALAQSKKTESLPELAELVRKTLIADLPETSTQIIDHLRAQAVDSVDIGSLMNTISPLVQTLRYGTARDIPETELRVLIEALAVEVCAGLRLASYQLDDDSAQALAKQIALCHQSLTLLETPAIQEEWIRQLSLMVHDDLVNPRIAGTALRCLHNDGVMSVDELESRFSWHLNGQNPEHTASFLESFLGVNAEVLLHDKSILRMIDLWLTSLEPDEFLAAVPLLRRGFSSFDDSSRRRLFQAIVNSEETESLTNAGLVQENPAFQAALPLLYKMLGVSQ